MDEKVKGKCSHTIKERQIAFYHGSCTICLESLLSESEEKMDEKVKEIRKKLDASTYIAQVRREIEELLSLLSSQEKKIEELGEELHQAACDISHFREQHHDDCKLVIELRERIKELEGTLAKIKSDPSIGKLEVEEWPESPDY
jgi:septal ring factor EnvC (AmiA/AmiB activator)